MKQRYRTFQRGPVFYIEDTTTGKQESLKTKDPLEARRLLAVRNEAHVQPALNLQIARAYLSASDPEVRTRTWQHVMDAMTVGKEGDTLVRWERAIKDKAFDRIRQLSLLETRAEHLLKVISEGTVSTNVFLRRIHNFVVDMSWIAWPVIPKRQWPAIHYKEKRAITAFEHQAILAMEHNAERRAFYELCWHLGGAQSDIANLQAEDIDWDAHTVGFFRKKTKSVSVIHLDSVVEKILRTLPATGPLFPKFRKLNTGHRATEFKRSCWRAYVEGVTLHSYRYAWAERAKTCGYPERFAQQALGHNSKAVHRSYAKKALVTLPSLVSYEREFTKKVVKLKQRAA